MLRIVTAGLTALFVTASPLAYAQTAASAATLSGKDWNNLTDMRIDIVKAALQLTPDQEKYWPAIEIAIRDRAKDRQARIAEAQKRADELRGSNAAEALRDRDTVAFMRRRANALEQRAADIKKLADAWQPLYQTLKPEQKKRMGFLALGVLRDMTDVREQRQARFEEEEEEE